MKWIRLLFVLILLLYSALFFFSTDDVSGEGLI